MMDERAINAVKSALAWMRSHNVKWVKTEEKVYSKEHEYAGTMDGLAYVDSCSDPTCCLTSYKKHLALIDWKSSNYLKIDYLLQTAAYQKAVIEEHGTPIDDRWILRLGKSEEEAGKFESWFVPSSDFQDDFAGFLACLNLTRLVDSVNERMKKQKAGIKRVKKEVKETAKAIAKEREKLKKALEKAEAKRLRAIEKESIKAEAKAKREAAKKEKECTSTSQTEEAPLLTSTNINTPLPNQISSTNENSNDTVSGEVPVLPKNGVLEGNPHDVLPEGTPGGEPGRVEEVRTETYQEHTRFSSGFAVEKESEVKPIELPKEN